MKKIFILSSLMSQLLLTTPTEAQQSFNIYPPEPQGFLGIGSLWPDWWSTKTEDFTSVYSLTDQTLAPGDSPILEYTNATTSAFDLTKAPTKGQIKVLKEGFYLINWEVDGLLTPPYPSPVPAWSLGILVNGTLAPGSTSGSFSFSPDDSSSHNSGMIIIRLHKYDIVQLANTSTENITCEATLFGSTAPVAAARINMILVSTKCHSD